MTERGSNFKTKSLGRDKYRTTIGIKPVYHYRNGIWRRIGNLLTVTGDPNFPVGVDELCQFRVKDKLRGQSPIIHFGKGETHVRFTPLGTNNVDGVVSGQSITYPEAWNSADLKLTIAGHRLQKDVALRAGHPQQFAFRIDEHAGFDPETLTFGDDFRMLQPILHSPNGVDDIPLVWDVVQQGGKYILTVTLPEGDWAGWMLDPTLELQPDETDGLDTTMRSDQANLNYGTNVYFITGAVGAGVQIRRELIQFSLSALPDAAVISSSVLSVYMTGDFATNTRVHRVYRVKRAWVEVEATWNIYSTGNNWQTAGGFGANDCEQTDIGSLSIVHDAAVDQFFDWPLSPTTKPGLDLGYGWLMKSDVEDKDGWLGASSDHVTAAERPKLVIDYELVSAGDAVLQRPFSPVFRGVFG